MYIRLTALTLTGMALTAAVALAEGSVTLNMLPQNNSGQTGTATLTPNGSQTEVVLNLTPSADGVAQPAHIHEGTCAQLGPIKWPLTNVENGNSTTVINVDLGTLSQGSYAINVHKSAQELGVSTSCADVKIAPPVPGSTTNGQGH